MSLQVIADWSKPVPVVIRVTDGASAAELQSNIIGSMAAGRYTGMNALLKSSAGYHNAHPGCARVRHLGRHYHHGRRRQATARLRLCELLKLQHQGRAPHPPQTVRRPQTHTALLAQPSPSIAARISPLITLDTAHS